MQSMIEIKTVACFFSALQKKVLNPSMYLASYSKAKIMSVGKMCIKRFEFACMAILSPATVSIVLCQCSIIGMPVPPVPNQPFIS